MIRSFVCSLLRCVGERDPNRETAEGRLSLELPFSLSPKRLLDDVIDIKRRNQSSRRCSDTGRRGMLLAAVR